MTDQESERPGGTQPGLKKSDLLTRQTDDGSFEFVVESGSAEDYSYEAEAPSSFGDNPQPLVSAGRSRRAAFMGGGVLLLIILVGAGFALTKSGGSDTKSESSTTVQEVAGFKPYGGGEVSPPAARTSAGRAERNVKRVPEPVQEPEEEYLEPEAFEVELSNVVPEPESMPEPETEWQVGENEQIREEDESIPRSPRNPLVRDRVDLQNIKLRSARTDLLRAIPDSDRRRIRDSEQFSSKRMDRGRRGRQNVGSAEEIAVDEMNDDSENQGFEEEGFDELEFEEEYYDEEEELEDEIY